jgi:hypothetical protein
MFLGIGESLAKEGLLHDKEDISFLFVHEMLNIEKFDSQKLVSSRKSHYEKQLSYTRVPRFILSSGETYYHSTLSQDSLSGVN